MSEIYVKAKQDSYNTFPDGVGGEIRTNRRGELVVNNWKVQAALDGRVFNFANLTPATLITGTVAYAATTPNIIMVVPTGTTMIPIRANFSIVDSAGTDNTIIIGCDTADLYTSGGIAGSALNNLRTNDPNTSALTTAKNGDTAIVMVDPAASERLLYNWANAFADTVGGRVVVWEPEVPPVLIGPATFFAYVYSTGTAMEYEYSIQWIEIPSTNVV